MRKMMASLTLLGLTACRATVAGDPDRPIKIEAHITIDVRQIKEEAHSIEDMVSGKAPVAAQKPRSRLGDGMASSMLLSRNVPPVGGASSTFLSRDVPQRGASLAWAQESTLSPEVQAAVNARRDRFAQLKSYKTKGWVGEDKEGTIAALGGGAEVQAFVEAENRDRETIYRAKLKEKNLPAEAIATIRAAFAQEQRDRAEPGEKIQLPSGEWTAK